MSQSRLGSLIEAIINVAIGLVVSLVANALIYPLFGFAITPRQNIALALIYTGISIARSYCIRRWFNARIVRLAQRLSD